MNGVTWDHILESFPEENNDPFSARAYLKIFDYMPLIEIKMIDTVRREWIFPWKSLAGIDARQEMEQRLTHSI